MFTARHILLVAMGLALMLAGCGTQVPKIQEIPGTDSERLVQAIVSSIHCEIRNAVTYVINEDRRNTPLNRGRLLAAWLLDWGAQVQITLQINEQSSFGPSGLYFPMNIFFLGGGVNLSSSATRIETLNYYYTVPELYKAGACSPRLVANIAAHPIGSLLIQSDLKLKEWLLAVVLGRGTGDISFRSTDKNAISHEIKFEIITSGNITPTWKLVHATINPVPPLLAASRDRTHDLLITFGPNDKATTSLGVGTPAANANLASQIGLAIRNQMIGNGLP